MVAVTINLQESLALRLRKIASVYQTTQTSIVQDSLQNYVLYLEKQKKIQEAKKYFQNLKKDKSGQKELSDIINAGSISYLSNLKKMDEN